NILLYTIQTSGDCILSVTGHVDYGSGPIGLWNVLQDFVKATGKMQITIPASCYKYLGKVTAPSIEGLVYYSVWAPCGVEGCCTLTRADILSNPYGLQGFAGCETDCFPMCM
ncbi:MAG: hypothetical protein ACOVP5_00425, partial [Chitinophagales bacterium]